MDSVKWHKGSQVCVLGWGRGAGYPFNVYVALLSCFRAVATS